MENEPTVTLSLEGADTAARFDLQAGVLLCRPIRTVHLMSR